MLCNLPFVSLQKFLIEVCFICEKSMANAEKPEEELSGYESESDDRVPPLTMRRREASDDEDGEDSGESGDGERRFGADRTVVVCSDGESSDADGLGGAPSESDGEEESCTDGGSEFEDKRDECGEAGIVETHFGAESTVGACSDGFDGAPPESDGESCTDEGNEFEEVEEGVKTAPVRQVVEKKERTEPCVIPTVGAFYMHDDRLRNNGGRRRNSQKPGGRNLWKFKDESKWVHDKFEELTLQDTHSKEVKEDITTKGRNQVRSINHGGDRYSNGEKFRRNVKGRGPVKYKPMAGRNNLNLHAKYHLNGSYLEKKSNTTSARVHFSDPSSMPSTYNAEYSQSSVQSGLPSARNLSMPFLNEFYRACSRAQQPLIQQRPVKSIFQPSLQSSTGHWGLSYASGTQASHIAFSPYSFECGDLESLLGPGPSISQFAPGGNQCITQGSGTSSITYGGTQFDQNYPATPFPKSLLGPRPSITQFTPAGNRGGITQGSGTRSSLYGRTHFDQNYPATPFPVVHFGGQHHGDLGYAGYAFQSLLGFGNSDITCIERRAKEITVGNKTPYKPELVNEEYRQQQINPRRYSKMNLQQVK